MTKRILEPATVEIQNINPTLTATGVRVEIEGYVQVRGIGGEWFAVHVDVPFPLAVGIGEPDVGEELA